MAGGRPIETDYIAWAEALDLWSKRDDATALCQFCTENDTYAEKVYILRDASPEFAQSLKKAKMRLAERLRRKLDEGTYNYGKYQRDIAQHDQFLHDHERAEKEYEAKLKQTTETNSFKPEDIAKLAHLGALIEASKPKD